MLFFLIHFSNYTFLLFSSQLLRQVNKCMLFCYLASHLNLNFIFLVDLLLDKQALTEKGDCPITTHAHTDPPKGFVGKCLFLRISCPPHTPNRTFFFPFKRGFRFSLFTNLKEEGPTQKKRRIFHERAHKQTHRGKQDKAPRLMAAAVEQEVGEREPMAANPRHDRNTERARPFRRKSKLTLSRSRKGQRNGVVCFMNEIMLLTFCAAFVFVSVVNTSSTVTFRKTAQRLCNSRGANTWVLERAAQG